jgi:secreted trypsin-like serine protease
VLAGVATVGVTTALGATGLSGSAQAIVGGQDSTGKYPFMVSVPMTATGHCAHEKNPAQPTGTVRVGSDRASSGGTVRTIVEKVVHPRYDITSKKRSFHDLALLRLDRPVVRQQPIQLADRAPRVGAPTRILGFGTTVDGQKAKDWKFPERLQQLDTRRAPAGNCLTVNPRDELCTESQVPNAMGCAGDSGGPQIQRIGGPWQLVGATSGDGDFADNPLCAGGPGIWTSVPAYRGWITRTFASHR